MTGHGGVLWKTETTAVEALMEEMPHQASPAHFLEPFLTFLTCSLCPVLFLLVGLSHMHQIRLVTYHDAAKGDHLEMQEVGSCCGEAHGASEPWAHPFPAVLGPQAQRAL